MAEKLHICIAHIRMDDAPNRTVCGLDSADYLDKDNARKVANQAARNGSTVEEYACLQCTTLLIDQWDALVKHEKEQNELLAFWEEKGDKMLRDLGAISRPVTNLDEGADDEPDEEPDTQ